VEVGDCRKLVSQLDNNSFEKCMWYSQSLMLELNHIYKPWYGEEPRPVLMDGLKEYLRLRYPYYKRVRTFVEI